jgi:hypothetical protein
MGFEPTIPAFKRAKTVHALDHATTVIGYRKTYEVQISLVVTRCHCSRNPSALLMKRVMGKLIWLGLNRMYIAAKLIFPGCLSSGTFSVFSFFFLTCAFEKNWVAQTCEPRLLLGMSVIFLSLYRQIPR